MTITEAIEALKNREKKPKFEESIDLDIKLKLKDNQKKESLKGSTELPHSFGTAKRIIVFCEDESMAKKAKAAGAVDAGLEELKEKVEGGWSEFDIVLATPGSMAKIVTLGKVLGQRPMPSPKNDTIVTDVEAGVKGFMGGKTSYTMEQGQGVVRVSAGKIAMDSEQIEENIVVLIKSILADARKFNPNPIKEVTVTSTMGPGYSVDVSEIL